jgi:hypothetical protein
MILTRSQSSRMTTSGAGNLPKCSGRAGAQKQMTAFDDDELCGWLMECIAEGSENFLCAFAEAAVAANTGDYLVIRPALLVLRRKHNAKHAI